MSPFRLLQFPSQIIQPLNFASQNGDEISRKSETLASGNKYRTLGRLHSLKMTGNFASLAVINE